MDFPRKKSHLAPMSKPFKHSTDDRKPKAFGTVKCLHKRHRLKLTRFRMTPYGAMTDAQKRICDAAERPGTFVPANLSDEELAAWFVARAVAKVSGS